MSRNLRESVQHLREYMFGGGSSYPGPEPGKMWSLGEHPGTPQAKIFRDDMEKYQSEKERAAKRKKADFRPDLRKLSLWLQQRRAQ